MHTVSLRLSDSPIPAEHMLMKNTSHVGVGITQSNAPTLNDALALYPRLKSEGKSSSYKPFNTLDEFYKFDKIILTTVNKK